MERKYQRGQRTHEVNHYELMLAYAFNLLGKRMYAEGELRNKLVRHFRCGGDDGGDDDNDRGENNDVVVQRVMTRLIELRYLDDEAYARAFIRQAFGVKSKGARWIYQELIKRGVAKHIIEECLRAGDGGGVDTSADASVGATELDAAVALARKRAPYVSRRIMRKQSSGAFEIEGHLMRLLTSRGFTFNVAKRAIRLIEADIRELLT